MTCVICGSSMEHKRKDAKYCSGKCKWTANKDTEKTTAYANSVHGRAVAMWHNSKSRDSNHSISVNWIKDKLAVGKCERTGIPFEFVYSQGRTAFSPSLDKINPTDGYTEDNTQVVIWMYNAAKNIFTDADVLYMAKCLVEKETT